MLRLMFFERELYSMKVLGLRKDPAELPLVNKTMMYIGRHHRIGESSIRSSLLHHLVSAMPSNIALVNIVI